MVTIGWLVTIVVTIAGSVALFSGVIYGLNTVAVKLVDNIPSPLHRAAQRGDTKKVQLLLDQGAVINAQSYYGETPLHWAVSRSHQAVVQLLLDSKGVKVDIQDAEERTPLHMAVARDNKQIIQKLLKKGAYGYKHGQADQVLTNYWLLPIVNSEQNQPFYIALLLAGVSPLDKRLPGPLESIQQTVILTVAEWLSPLNLSESVYQTMAPKMFRALPRLLHWLAILKQAEQERAEEKDHLKASYSDEKSHLQGLKHFLLFSKEEREEDQDRLSVLRGLQKSIPLELIELIRSCLIVDIIADTLIKIYAFPYRIAQHLAKEAIAYPDEYIDFHKRLFDHKDWTVPCLPPNHSVQPHKNLALLK